ncbi:MAG: methyltransferase [Candidatus Krumholzibacteriota bacterium]|nr:methyltransferase [Candidatus Krumholzibacteriota bacterium]
MSNFEDAIFRQIRGLWTGHALLAAKKLGIMELLMKSGLSIPQLADQLSVDERGMRALISTLSDIGIVNNENDVISLTALGRETSLPDRSLSGYIKFHSLLSNHWANLDKLLKKGSSLPIDPNISVSPEIVKSYIEAMDALGMPISEELVNALDIKSGDRVLDLGGGSSVHARAILSKHPDAQVTLLDRPIVIKLLKEEFSGKWNISKNLILTEGDYLNLRSDEKYDIILLSNIIHNESSDNILNILESCSRVLNEGSRLAILDYFYSANNKLTSSPAGFDLLLYLITSHGKIQNLDYIEDLVKQAGFIEPVYSVLGNYRLGIYRKA